MGFVVRPEAETEADRAAIRRVNEQAFGQPAEADLVDALRDAARPFVSIVAEHDGAVVGHIAFSPVSIDGGSDEQSLIMGLAPMAVLPEHQKLGIGSALVRSGLDACRAIGAAAVVVLGHPAYYPRFGFEVASRRSLQCPYDAPDEAFLVVELLPGSLAGRSGMVRYHDAFAGL